MDSTEIPKLVSEVSILFTTDGNIAKLNKRYRKKSNPTDVLSFPQLRKGEKTAYSPSLGDVVISVDRSIEQARRHSVSIQAEILRLLVHGILHLFGYDHENVTPREAKRMYQLEREILIGLSREKLVD